MYTSKKSKTTDLALAKEVRELTKELRLMRSFRYHLLRSVLMGAGTAIGATLIATLILTSLWRLIKVTGFESIVQNFGLEKILQR